jgi:flavin reductase (DIM6/NTAB) family NADH-FMN oxidoreductase RutF
MGERLEATRPVFACRSRYPRDGAAAPTVDPATFRDVMAEVCSPVSVITTLNGGWPHGTTVSSFSSLSLDPPMVLAALSRQSELLLHLRRTGRFGLNVLSSSQHELAARFARKGTDKFDGVHWSADRGVPHLAGAAGFLSCTVADLSDGGDHVIVVGEVTFAAAAAAAPLTYHRRRFGTHVPLGDH